jgi:hypothetical protein
MLEITLTPEPTGTLSLAIKGPLPAVGEGVAVAVAEGVEVETVASKKPLETRSLIVSSF